MMDIHPGLMIWTIISFVIVLAVLWKFAWNPILAALERREQGIKGDIESARKAREEAEGSLAEYRRKLAEAQSEAQTVVSKARQDAERVREELMTRSKQDAEKLVERARQQIDLERQAAINEIRGEVANLAIAAAEKVIGKSLDAEDHRRLIKQSLEEGSS